MTLQECYAALGGNYEDVLGRMHSERMIQKFVLKFLQDGNYDTLCRALAAGTVEEAFRAAHTIKGMCLNLSFDRLAASSVEMTEALRSGDLAGALAVKDQVDADYKHTTDAIRAFQAGLPA